MKDRGSLMLGKSRRQRKVRKRASEAETIKLIDRETEREKDEGMEDKEVTDRRERKSQRRRQARP